MLGWLRNLYLHYWYSPCANIVSTMSDTGPYLFLANRYAYPRVQPHTTAPSRMRTTPASWCQPRRYPAAEILSAVSCQPVTTTLHWKKYIRGHLPVVLSLSAFVNWSAISCIRTSVRSGRGSKALPLALHDKEGSFFINSRTEILPSLHAVVYLV